VIKSFSNGHSVRTLPYFCNILQYYILFLYTLHATYIAIKLMNKWYCWHYCCCSYEHVNVVPVYLLT